VRVLWDRSDVAGSGFREGRLHNELDCAAWTGRILSYRAFRAGGSVAAARDEPTAFEPLDPARSARRWRARFAARRGGTFRRRRGVTRGGGVWC